MLDGFNPFTPVNRWGYFVQRVFWGIRFLEEDGSRLGIGLSWFCAIQGDFELLSVMEIWGGEVVR